jgi:hypothetical protein
MNIVKEARDAWATHPVNETSTSLIKLACMFAAAVDNCEARNTHRVLMLLTANKELLRQSYACLCIPVAADSMTEAKATARWTENKQRYKQAYVQVNDPSARVGHRVGQIT